MCLKNFKLLASFFILLVPLLFPYSAHANAETAPVAKTGYACQVTAYCGDQPLDSAQTACELMARGVRYTDAVFVPPLSCSMTVPPSGGYPAQKVTAQWLEILSVCPGGTLYNRLGYYTRWQDPATCACASYEKYFEDSTGEKKCISVSEVSKKNQWPSKPSDNGPCCDSKPSVGQPISPGTGNMWHVELDYAAPDTANELRLERIYNSTPFVPDANVVRSFGVRWTHQYEVMLSGEAAPEVGKSSWERRCWRRADFGVQYCDPLPLVSIHDGGIPPAVSILRGDGKKFLYVHKGDSYISDADDNSRLIAAYNADKNLVVGWTYITGKDDRTEKFDAGGRLLSISSRSGRVQRLTYSDGNSNSTLVGRSPSDSPVCSNVQGGDIQPAGRLLCVTDNWGLQLQFEYDAHGRVSKVITPDSHEISYEYDGASGGCPANTLACSANNLTKVTYPDGNSRIYSYNEASQINSGSRCAGYPAPQNNYGNLPNALTGLIDENGARYISWTYECKGRAASSQLANGAEKVAVGYNEYSFEYGAAGGTDIYVTHYTGSFEKPASTVTRWTYYKTLDSAKISSIDGPCPECGSAVHRDYDVNGNVAGQQSWKQNNYTAYTYDLTRNLEIKRNVIYAEQIVSTKWHPLFRLPERITEPKRISTFAYDPKGNLLSKTVQASSDKTGASGLTVTGVGPVRTWSYSYNEFGQVLMATGPREDGADVSRFSYDSATGNLLSVTNALGHVTSYSNYDPNGRVGTITAPNGTQTMIAYTSRGWIESVTMTNDGHTSVTSYQYDGVGQVKRVTQPDQSAVTYVYDDAHRLIEVRDAQGNSVHYTLDIRGNRTQEKVLDSRGNVTRQIARSYDTMDRLQSVSGAAQ